MVDMTQIKIQEIDIELWNRSKVRFTPYPDVNIIVGIFLLEEKESVVLIDEPENSLDISWQYKLINLFVKLNPNSPFFITTHSPGIFGDGWGDKIIYMEDVTTKIPGSFFNRESYA